MKNFGLLSSNLPGVLDLSHLSPSRDRWMTPGKLLDNGAQLFIVISILIMTKRHPRDPKTDNRTDSRNGASRK